MNLFYFSFLFFTLFFIPEKSTQDEQTIERIKAEIIKLGAKLLYYSINPDENLVYSPFNLYIALSQIHLAAKGTTQDYMREILGIHKDTDTSKFHQSMNELLQHTEKSSGIKLTDTIFVHNNISIKKSFQENIKTYYNSEIIDIDFLASAEEIANQINRLIANKTENRISPLLIDPLFTHIRIVVVNTLYFKALWDVQFNPSNTKEAPFYTPNGNITVQMMEKTENACYTETPLHRTAKLAVSKSFSLGIILHKNQEKDYVQENLLHSETVKKIIDQPCERVPLNIRLPRTVLKWSKNITESLSGIGFRPLFTDAADLTNMEDVKHVRVSEFYDAIDLKFTEEGTEATIASASKDILRYRRSSNNVEFTVDRPFFFWLMENETGTLLFFGLVNNPNSV